MIQGEAITRILARHLHKASIQYLAVSKKDNTILYINKAIDKAIEYINTNGKDNYYLALRY